MRSGGAQAGIGELLGQDAIAGLGVGGEDGGEGYLRTAGDQQAMQIGTSPRRSCSQRDARRVFGSTATAVAVGHQRREIRPLRSTAAMPSRTRLAISAVRRRGAAGSCSYRPAIAVLDVVR